MLFGSTKLALAFLLGSLAAAVSGAETAPGAAPLSSALEQLTLRQAEIFFAKHNREVQLAQRAVEGAEADIVIAGARPNPSFSISTSQISPSAGIGSGSLFDKRFDTIVGLTQVFERGGKRELRTDAAQFIAKASRSDRDEIERQQKIALHGAYYDLVLAQDKLRISEETVASFQKTLDAAALRLKAGDIAPTDVARISVDALRARNDARTIRAERDKARLTLAYLIGAEREAGRIRAVDEWPQIDQPTLAADLEQILSARADVQAARARVDAANKNRDLAHALRTRDITAGIQYERAPGGVNLGADSFGFSVSVPLFTSYFYEGQIRRAEAELQAARENLGRVRALALGEIAKTRTDLDSAADRVRRFREELLVAAEKAAQGAEFAYSRGAIGVTDLLDARRQLHAARLEAATVLADYAKARSAWRAAIAAPSATVH